MNKETAVSSMECLTVSTASDIDEQMEVNDRCH